MRWTRQRRARNGIAGRIFPVSDRPARGRTTLLTAFARTRRTARGPARPLARMVADGEVVWSWRPGAGVKCCGDASGPTGFEMHRQSARRRWQDKPGHRGEREVSRKPSRRESRSDPVEPVVHSCASCAHDPRVRSASGFPCALCSRRRVKLLQTPGAIRAAGMPTHVGATSLRGARAKCWNRRGSLKIELKNGFVVPALSRDP